MTILYYRITAVTRDDHLQWWGEVAGIPTVGDGMVEWCEIAMMGVCDSGMVREREKQLVTLG